MADSSWKDFYASYLGEALGKPNLDGWINFNCVMPWHEDTDRHAAINIVSGNYRCVHDTCRKKLRESVSRPKAEAISAIDFLRVTQGLEAWDAQREIADFSLSLNGKPVDEKLEKGFRVLPRVEQERVSDAAAVLRSNYAAGGLTLDYCESRGLRLETLEAVGAGYIEDYLGHEYLSLPYYAGSQLVAVRLRSWYGTRKRFIKGSSQTLYCMDRLAENTSRTAVIAEGETDCLVLSQIFEDAGFGHIPVVGSPGVDFRYEWARHFQEYTRVIVIPQTDRASQGTLVGNLRGIFGSRLEVVQLPWPPNVYGGNDVSDFIRACPDGIEELLTNIGLSDDDTVKQEYSLTLDRLRDHGKQDPQWLINNLIERGTKTLIVGEPKSYKTWIAVNLAYAVCTASSFMGNDTWRVNEKFSTLLIEEEGPVHRIGQRFSKVFGESDGVVHVIHRQGVKLDNPESFSKLRQAVLQIRPDLIIFDPYASIHQQDENTVQGAQVVQDALNELLRALPSSAIVVLHHTPKSGDGPRGSGALWGAADAMLRVTKVDTGRIIIRVDERDLPDETEGGMEFVLDEATGRFNPSTTISLSSRAKLITSVEDGVPAEIYDYLIDRGEDWVPTEDIRCACQLSENTVRKHLRTLIREGRIEDNGDGGRNRPKLYRAIHED
jgi:hypothetical protein